MQYLGIPEAEFRWEAGGRQEREFQMNWVDILVLVVWGLTALWGVKVGLVRMVVPLLMVVIGLALSSRIAGPVGNVFGLFTDNENFQTVGAFIAIYLVLFISGIVLSSLLRSALSIIPLGGTANNVAGMVVGIILGFVLLSGVLTGLQKFPVAGADETISQSPLGSFMADNFDVVIRGIKLIPGDWNDKVSDFGGEIRGEIQGKVDDLKEGAQQPVPGPK